MDRNKKIIKTSIIGILMNLVLVAFKAAVGLITGSIAVVLDAVNNLSDALSSVITIIGTKLSAKAPDKKHPFGYGRIEYLTSIVIAVIVLLAGITSLKESVEKIIHPSAAQYSIISLIIIAVAVVVKFGMGMYVKGVGKSINSDSLVASGTDAFYDSILSLATFVTAIISLLFKVSLEGIVGAVISLIIIKAGIEILVGTLNTIIGGREDKDFTDKIKKRVSSYEGVFGAYDLTLHNYGPTQIIGSVHIEVSDTMQAKQIHKLTRQISAEIYSEFGVILTVGVYAANDSSENTAKMKERVYEIVGAFPEILQIHGFYADEANKSVMFDLIVDFEADANAVKEQVFSKVTEIYPDYRFDIILDTDYSE